MAGSQKTVLKNPVSLNISLGLLVLIIFGLLTGLYYLSPVEKVPSITNSLMVGFMILGLWLIIRNFIFKLEIRETGLGYRSETGQSVLIPWSNIKRFSTRKSVLLKRRLEIHCVNEGKPQTLSLWAVTAWQNPEFMELLVEKAGLSLPDDWENQKSKSIQIDTWIAYVFGGFFLAFLVYHLIRIFFIDNSLVVFASDWLLVEPPIFIGFILILIQFTLCNHYQKQKIAVQFYLSLLFLILSIPYLNEYYKTIQYGFMGHMLSLNIAMNDSLLRLFVAASLGGCLFAGLYPFWTKTRLNGVKTLLPATVLISFFLWFIPITLLPSPPKGSLIPIDIGNGYAQINFSLNDGTLGVISKNNNDESNPNPGVHLYVFSDKGSLLQKMLFTNPDNKPYDRLEGYSQSTDKQILLCYGVPTPYNSNDTALNIFRYDSLSKSLKSFPITLSKKSSEGYGLRSQLFHKVAWTPDGKLAAFFVPIQSSEDTVSIPKEYQALSPTIDSQLTPNNSLILYDREKDKFSNLFNIKGHVSSPFWQQDGSLGFFKTTTHYGTLVKNTVSSHTFYRYVPSGYSSDIIQIPAKALLSSQPLKQAQIIPFYQNQRNFQVIVEPDSYWAFSSIGKENNKRDMLFVELTTGRFSQVTINNGLQNMPVFRPGNNNEFICREEVGKQTKFVLYSLANPDKTKVLYQKNIPLFFSNCRWVNNRYLMIFHGLKTFLLDTQTSHLKNIWPIRSFSPLGPRYINTNYFIFKYPVVTDSFMITPTSPSLFNKRDVKTLLYRYDLPSN